MEDLFDTLNTESLFGLDIAFVIDSTGSMISYITGAKQSIKEIMTQSRIRFNKYKADESMLKFGIVAYRDHPPQESSFLTKIHDFSDFESSSNFLDNLTASGGGDPPEAVLDGLNEAVKNLTWRDTSEKILFLLLDNPGHGKRFGTNYDCPCELHEKDILVEMKNKQINFHILRPKEDNKKLDTMIEEFKKYIEVETMALDKHKRFYVNENIDKGLDSDTEMRIFNRVKYRTMHKFKETKKYNSRNTSKSNSKEKNGKLMDLDRSRSRSKSPKFKEKKTTETKENGRLIKEREEKRKEIELIDDDALEKGIRDIITSTVILKLDKQLQKAETIKEEKGYK